VITGDERAFAASADIGEMSYLGGFNEVFLGDFNGGDWLRISTCGKPVIAAVAGYAFGAWQRS
jgi:enoyl-CoA hydratase